MGDLPLEPRAGGGANLFLEILAKRAKAGSTRPRTRPASRTSSSRRRSRSPVKRIVEEPFFPVQTSSSPGFLRGLDAATCHSSRGSATGPPSSWWRRTCSSHLARRPAPRAVAVRAGAGGRVDLRHDRPVGQGLGRLDGFNRFFSQLVSWTFPGEETGGIEATFETRAATTGSTSRASRPRVAARLLLDPRGRRRPDLDRGRRPRPGRAGRVRAGSARLIRAYAVGSPRRDRVVAARADGRAGRPTAAEYRLLGATGLPRFGAGSGRWAVVATVAGVWAHDLTSTSQFTHLWPLLLVLALLLWPPTSPFGGSRSAGESLLPLAAGSARDW